MKYFVVDAILICFVVDAILIGGCYFDFVVDAILISLKK